MKQIIWMVLSLAIAFSSWSCSGSSNADQNQPVEKGIPVKLLTVEPRPFFEYLQVTGTVRAQNQIQIVVEEGGMLQKVIRDKGNYCQKGDTLAVLDNQVLTASYQESQAALRQAQLEFNSKKVLFEKKAISENDFLSSQYALDRAQAGYNLTRARYGKLFITAPLSGFINNRFYDDGAYALPMTPIFELIDAARVKVVAGIAERFLNDIRIGTPVEITFDAYSDLKINSQVTFISRKIETSNRTFTIQVEVPNRDRKLTPEMVANLKILRRSFANEIVIPLDALIDSDRGRYVFVANQNQAQRLAVEILAVHDDSVVVRGLQAGQNLVVVGQQELTDGDRLTIEN